MASAATNAVEPLCFLPLDDVIKRVGLGKTKIYEMISLGEFPKPKKMGRASRWSNHAIIEWQCKQ